MSEERTLRRNRLQSEFLDPNIVHQLWKTVQQDKINDLESYPSIVQKIYEMLATYGLTTTCEPVQNAPNPTYIITVDKKTKITIKVDTNLTVDYVFEQPWGPDVHIKLDGQPGLSVDTGDLATVNNGFFKDVASTIDRFDVRLKDIAIYICPVIDESYPSILRKINSWDRPKHVVDYVPVVIYDMYSSYMPLEQVSKMFELSGIKLIQYSSLNRKPMTSVLASVDSSLLNAPVQLSVLKAPGRTSLATIP